MSATTAPPAVAAHEFKFGEPVHERFRKPAAYHADEDLEAAVRVALLLGMPLLLTGDPGCGKTSLAYWLAWKLQLGEVLAFNVKSTTTGRELLYEFDELARFRDSQAGSRQPLMSYLKLNALGLGILLSSREDSPAGADGTTYGDLARGGHEAYQATAFERRHVVLVDELDKAPRDTPNDLLMEVEQMRFRIGELGTWVQGDPAHRPIVIITSNSEKSLPEPFLRRCVFHHIRAPDERRRREIVQRRQHPFTARGTLYDEAMAFFEKLPAELGRAPGTAELLAWLTALDEQVARAQLRQPDARPIASLKGLVAPTLGTLAKTKEDLERAARLLDRERLG